MKILVILDYNKGMVDVYPADGYITDDTIEELGYNLDEVSWMITTTEDSPKDKIKFHTRIVKG